MPIYSYYCSHCDSKCERLVSLRISDRQQCDRCGKPLTLLISRPAPFPVGKYGKAGGLK